MNWCFCLWWRKSTLPGVCCHPVGLLHMWFFKDQIVKYRVACMVWMSLQAHMNICTDTSKNKYMKFLCFTHILTAYIVFPLALLANLFFSNSIQRCAGWLYAILLAVQRCTGIVLVRVQYRMWLCVWWTQWHLSLSSHHHNHIPRTVHHFPKAQNYLSQLGKIPSKAILSL